MEGGEATPIGVEDDSINPEEVEEEEVETGKLLVDVGMMKMISTWIWVPVGHSNLPHLEVQEVSVGLVEEPAEELAGEPAEDLAEEPVEELAEEPAEEDLRC